MRVWLNGVGVALECERTAGTWNGHPVPAVTAAQLEEWVDATRSDDANAERWSVERYFLGGAVNVGIYDAAGLVDGWPAVGTNDRGVTVFELDGWTWSTEDEN
jgi:hypothetical protein